MLILGRRDCDWAKRGCDIWSTQRVESIVRWISLGNQIAIVQKVRFRIVGTSLYLHSIILARQQWHLQVSQGMMRSKRDTRTGLALQPRDDIFQINLSASNGFTEPVSSLHSSKVFDVMWETLNDFDLVHLASVDGLRCSNDFDNTWHFHDVKGWFCCLLLVFFGALVREDFWEFLWVPDKSCLDTMLFSVEVKSGILKVFV